MMLCLRLKQRLLQLSGFLWLSAAALSASPAELAERGFIRPLKVATWNLEHLAFPADTGCKPRSAQQLASLRHYAEAVDADIFALQEVASEKAVRLLFPAPQWQVIVSARPDSEPYPCRESAALSTPQKVAYAVRSSVKVMAVKHYRALALDNPGLRYGLEIQVAAATGPLDLLNVHMKSGCFVSDYRRQDTPECKEYGRQASVLDLWVEQKEAAGRSYLLLGDFNHTLSAAYNHLMYRLSHNQNGEAASLTLATRDLVGCHPEYPAPIDHIILGGKTIQAAFSDARVYAYDNRQPEAMLSDHCAVSVTLFAPDHALSTAVKWHTLSKEYSLIARAAYRQATQILNTRPLPEEDWVVVLDVDETVLDNSPYQVQLERAGLRYTPESWARWVQTEQAELVPGAQAFIETVWQKGGRIALVTNRDASLNRHTWANLQSQGVRVTPENTCLLGRSQADIDAVGSRGIVNDKDLRRQSLGTGRASCFALDSSSSVWRRRHQIVMHVGDNIEDFPGVTQAKARPEALLHKLGYEYILLPNAVYGSW